MVPFQVPSSPSPSPACHFFAANLDSLTRTAICTSTCTYQLSCSSFGRLSVISPTTATGTTGTAQPDFQPSSHSGILPSLSPSRPPRDTARSPFRSVLSQAVSWYSPVFHRPTTATWIHSSVSSPIILRISYLAGSFPHSILVPEVRHHHPA